MDALSVAQGELKSPQHGSDQERETASNLRLDVFALSSQQGRALHVVHSVVCFHTKPCLCHLRSVSPSREGGGVTRATGSSLAALSGVADAMPAPEQPLFLHFHPVATEPSHETLEGGWEE